MLEPVAPIRPAIGDYQPSVTAANNHTAQYHAAYGDDAVVPPYTPLRPSDLSNAGKTSYKDDVEDFKSLFDEYKILDQKYQREKNNLAQITDFIRSSVSAHLFTNCCKPSQPYRSWITKLSATVGVRTEDELHKARDRYQQAIRPMRAAIQWDTWLTEVDHAVTEAKAAGVPDCLNDQFIKNDFAKATAKHFQGWTISFMENGLPDATVTATDMFLRFRKQASLIYPVKSKSNKASFAAGGPTLAGKEADDNYEARPKKGQGRNQRQKRQQRDDDTIDYTPLKCEACDGHHELSKCWYVMPETAPPDWRARESVKKMAQERISNNAELQDRIRATKRPRSRTSGLKKTHSAAPTIEPTSED
jgi:hypothetical protein